MVVVWVVGDKTAEGKSGGGAGEEQKRGTMRAALTWRDKAEQW